MIRPVGGNLQFRMFASLAPHPMVELGWSYNTIGLQAQP